MNNNNSNHVSIDFNPRLLQEIMAIRTEISQQGLQLNVLNTGLRQQLTAHLNKGRGEQSSALAGDDGTTSILDPLYKSRTLANVDQSGPRVIAANITGKSGASPAQRFNAMLQHLNKIFNGPETLALTTRQLSALGHLQQDQLYYCLALENVALHQESLRIGLCKKQWCVRLLLSQAFKAVRSDAAAADIAAAKLAISVPQDDEAVDDSVEAEVGAAGAQVIMRGDSSAEDDGNPSTTSKCVMMCVFISLYTTAQSIFSLIIDVLI